MIKTTCTSVRAAGCILRAGQSVTFGRSLLRVAVILLMGPSAGWAADVLGTGTIEGHVSNATNGNSLTNALVALQGTNVVTATNDLGEYRLSNVPPGQAQITVTFAGMDTQTVSVAPEAGKVLHQDFALTLASSAVVKMDKFTVDDRELSGQAVADEERKTAPNIASVVSIDEFGNMGEGNIGEYLKYIPGVDIEYDPQDPQYASIRGMPPDGTIMELDGEVVPPGVNQTRSYNLGIMPAGNVDRVEVTKEPTPDMPANAVGGMINVITKNGFSVNQPLISYDVSLITSSPQGGNMGAVDYSLHSAPAFDPKTSGAFNRPAYDLSLLLPVNKKVAFTFAVGQSNRRNNDEYLYALWDQVRNVETTNRLENVDYNKISLLGEIAAIWKINDRSTLRASYQATSQEAQVRQLQINALTGAGASGGEFYSQGASAVGSVTTSGQFVDEYHPSKHASLSYRYEGSDWVITSAATWSQAGTQNKDIQDGFFDTVATSLSSLVVNFNGINGFGEHKASIDTATSGGVPVNIYNEGNYPITTVASSGGPDNTNTVKHINFSAQRRFDFLIPFSIKVGAQIDQSTYDTTGGAFSYTFSPPGSDLASNYNVTDVRSYAGANGSPITVDWINPYKMYQLYHAEPGWFTYTTAQQAGQYVSQVTVDKNLEETIPAAFIRGDVRFFHNHLWLVGGVRFEQTRDNGVGPLENVGAGYEQNPNGTNILSSTGALIPISTNTLTEDQLEYTQYGQREERTYASYYPSVNATYYITDKLLFRTAYARTIGRPDISLILPGTTVTDSATAVNTITVVNTALKPWTSQNYDAALELYDFQGATVSISGYRKDLTNFFGTTLSPATPAILAANGLTNGIPSDYQVSTMANFGAATIQGLEFAYRQSLAPFVPQWAKGLEFFANVTTETLSGPNAASFTTFSPHDTSWGFIYTNSRLRASWDVQYKGWVREAAAAQSATIPANVYDYYLPITRTDVSVEYRLSKTRLISVYGAVRNLFDDPTSQGFKGPGVAPFTVPSYFQWTGCLVSLGIKGQF